MQLLFFHGPFCPPCAATQQAAEQYAAEHGVPLYTFRCDDVYGGNDMARQNRVQHLPCLILKDDSGAELVRTASRQQKRPEKPEKAPARKPRRP